MLNYLKNTILKPISNYMENYTGKRPLAAAILTAGVLTLASCSYDVMDSWHRLRKREQRQEQRVQIEINKLDDIGKDRVIFKNALESALEEIKRTEEGIPEESTPSEEGTENDQ